MTTSTSNTGWLASAKGLLTRASTAAGFAPKGYTGPVRELTTLATEPPNKPAASRWNWWGTKASSPFASTPQDTAPTVSASAKPQASGWLSTYNPFTRWTGAKATAEPSVSAAPAENNITHLASTNVDEWLSKTQEVPQTAESLYTELKSLTVDERNKLFRSAPHMCGGNWEKTMWNSLTPSQLKELEIAVGTTQQDTIGKGLRAAWKNAAQAPKELTTLPSKPDETEKPGLKRRRSVTFADSKSGAGTTMTPGGASTGGPIRGILKKHLPTPAASSLVTVN